MKAIISNKIYMTVTPQLYRALDSKLTYTIPSYDGSNFTIIKNLKVINYNLQGGNMLVAFPVGRTDLIPDNYTVEDKRSTNYIADFPEFLGNLRPSQQELYDLVEDNCIINAKVGFGKTFSGLAIASKLQQKTLIVTHTVALRDQWDTEIRKVLGIKPGIIGSGKFNIDSPVVIANTQTLVKQVPKISREFGLLIMDEMHHVSSPTFSKIIDGMFCRYKIGLSGTIERKDKKHVVFQDYFGHTVFKPEKENTLEPEVHVIHSGIGFSNSSTLTWADKVNALLNSSYYRDLVVVLADKYANEGHKVLISADRVEFLEYINEHTKNKSALIIGKTIDRASIIDSVIDGETKIVCGTQSIVSEGLSINPLSCLILGTPLNNMPLLEQLIGRVVRQAPNKLKPVIVDIKLDGGTVTRQFNNRLGHYMKSDYKITNIK